MDDLEEEVQIVTTAVAGLTLFETFDPRNLLTPEQVEVIDATLEAEPPAFGACLPLTPPEVALFSYQNRIGSWIEPTAVLFVRPESRVKAVMATGAHGLGRRLLLLNGRPDSPQGVGYSVKAETRLTQTTYRIARDMTLLNQMRIENLDRHGVRSSRLEAFHRKAGMHLKAAEEARQQRRHRAFLDRSRRAWAYAAAAYRDVAGTQAGVIRGALFLLAALVPFAHFAERLIFGFPDLRRQVIGYFAFFIAGFIALRHLHPAFELSISPAITLLGFVILALGILVTSIGISRLNRELRALAGPRRGRSDLQRAGALMTSLSVGLAHLRRRPLRTGLTCTTLVLLTFSVLSFTSIRSSLRTNRVDLGQGARYEGALVRMQNWKTMEIAAYRSLLDRFGPDRTAPRAWLSVSSLASTFRIERADLKGWAAGVPGIAGLSAQEARLMGPQLTSGRWLKPGEEDACLLPSPVARTLAIGPEDLDRARIRVFGEVYRVVGLLAPGALNEIDLNGEPLTPLDPEAQQPVEADVGAGPEGQGAIFTHMPGSQVAVLPYRAVMRFEKARLASVGILLEDVQAEANDLAETLDPNLFVGIGGRRYLVNTVGVASVSGLSDLAVPVSIAALIVLNTMLGAVYERTREIGTFNAVGLAPKHVSGLFMAEACAFAIVGGVSGYLLGQAAAQAIGRFGLLAGLELNYSSLASILTLGLVMVVVMLSALYPAWMAGRICTPGIERRWKPPQPEGDRLRMALPFTLVRQDALGMVAFLAEFWEAHREQSIGAGFYLESLAIHRKQDRLELGARVWLAPFDQGVTQQVSLVMSSKHATTYFEVEAALERVSGDYETWRRVSRTFLDDLRKQFLIWRTLTAQDREFYVSELARWETAGSPP